MVDRDHKDATVGTRRSIFQDADALAPSRPHRREMLRRQTTQTEKRNNGQTRKRNYRRPPPTADEIRLAERRAAICQTCSECNGIRREQRGWPLYVVRCKACGCGGLSLIRSNCKLGKWDHIHGPAASRKTDAELIEDRTEKRNGRSVVLKNRGKRKLLLRSQLSPGDILTMTAAVRDLHRAYPGRFETDVDTPSSELWEHNPYVTCLDTSTSDYEKINLQYPLINESNQRPVHFLRGYTAYLEQKLGLQIPTTEFRGDIHLSGEERRWMNQVEEQFGWKGPFWIIVSGGKHDFTAKWWNPESYQAVVDHFHGRLQFVQCGDQNHWHPPLKGVYSLVGHTSIRQFVRLMYHAAGAVCPVTFAMHLAAAVPTKTERLRPCVVLAGGREPPHWEVYPGHRFLHTIGALPCCATGGCWRSRCQKMNDGDAKDVHNVCERPVQVAESLVVPQCMEMITPEAVISAIEQYLMFSL